MKKLALLAIALLAFMAGNVFAKGVPVLQVDNNPAVTVVSEASSPARVSTSPGNSGTGVSELYFMIQTLQNQIRALTGRIEEQEHELNLLKKQGLTRYRDLDSRILALQNPSGSPQSTSLAPIQNTLANSSLPATITTLPLAVKTDAQGAPVPATIQTSAVGGLPVVVNDASSGRQKVPSNEQKRMYAIAFSSIKDKNFSKAVTGLQAFIEKYPSTDLTGNAYYWLGEVYLAMSRLEEARDAFMVVVTRFPSHRKAPDALFKLGVTYHQLGKDNKAKEYLSQVISQYSGSSAARLATEYMKNL